MVVRLTIQTKCIVSFYSKGFQPEPLQTPAHLTWRSKNTASTTLKSLQQLHLKPTTTFKTMTDFFIHAGSNSYDQLDVVKEMEQLLLKQARGETPLSPKAMKRRPRSDANVGLEEGRTPPLRCFKCQTRIETCGCGVHDEPTLCKFVEDFDHALRNICHTPE